MGTAGSSEQQAQATVGVSHEVSTVAHKFGDVFSINQVILTSSGRASPITAPVGHQETEALIGKRSLSLPLVGACR
jgi:hypothetical protein